MQTGNFSDGPEQLDLYRLCPGGALRQKILRGCALLRLKVLQKRFQHEHISRINYRRKPVSKSRSEPRRLALRRSKTGYEDFTCEEELSVARVWGTAFLPVFASMLGVDNYLAAQTCVKTSLVVYRLLRSFWTNRVSSIIFLPPLPLLD